MSENSETKWACEDCGTGLERGGICPNCHEELFIATYQAEFMEPMSKEFSDTVDAQAAALRSARGTR